MQNRHFTGYLIIAGILLSALVACNQKAGHRGKNVFTTSDTISPPLVKTAGNPTVRMISAGPSPEVIDVSAKPPAIERPADFMVSMPNFNTEQGLALSTILCGFKDKAGNLWFGTSGNGVSKYDGQAFTNYTSSNGLIHNLINNITQDSKGNIWFGTYGGVSVYDGRSFVNYTTAQGLADNNINDVFEDTNGNIWISTFGGLSMCSPGGIDKGDRVFFTYAMEPEFSGKYVGVIFEDKMGNLWFGTANGVVKYYPDENIKKGKTFVNYSKSAGLAGKVVKSITEDEEGILWFGTNDGVIRYDPAKDGTGEKAFILLTTTDGLVDNRVSCSLEDAEGNIWFGTQAGVSEYRKEDASFLNFTTEQGLANNKVSCITEDNNGSLWFGTSGGGLSRYDGPGIVGFTVKQGLPGIAVYAIAEESNGDLWFGTDEGGITKFGFNKQRTRRSYFENYTTRQGLKDNYILTMMVDKTNNLWFGANNGLSKISGKTLVNYTTEQGLVNNNITCLTEDKEGNILIGTYEGGMSKFDGKSFSNYTIAQGLVHNTVWNILEDKAGNIWFATRGGLSFYNGISFVNFTKAQGLPDNKLSTVIEDKMGNILIGSWGGGVSVIRKRIVDSLTRQNLPTIKGAIFENFSTDEGLSNNVVYDILEDQSGNIFIGTNLGITVLRGGLDPTGKNFAKDGIENYNQSTGYPIKDISNNNGMLLDKNGIIWTGTGDKLVRFDYKSIHRRSEALPVFIESVKINNENISWYTLQTARMEEDGFKRNSNYIPSYLTDEQNVFGRKLSIGERDTMITTFRDVAFDSISRFYAVPENLVLPFAFNNISFDFVGIETTRPFLVHYQYMLEGHDKIWSPVGNNTSASYGNLPNGNYTFMVKAQSPEGVWSKAVFYSFEILRPWYLSWPAYLFYTLLFLSGIFIVDYVQRRRTISKERQRAMKHELEQAKEIETAYHELKATQAQLIQAEKMASLGELTAGIAHEIQNPLNFVNNFSEVSIDLMREMNEEMIAGNSEEVIAIAGDLKQNLEKIQQHGMRASSIVKGMLEHSHAGSGEKEPTDINALTDEYLRLAYHGLRAKDSSFNASMKTDFDETIGKIEIIPQDIGRVILNLITNAFYTVTEKRKQLGPDYEPVVSVSTGRINGRVELIVKDNGNGIPDSLLQKIFQPFFTTKPSGEGTGLGLSLSYDIVKAHGGELKVETKEGIGSEFIIVLPK